MPDALGLTLMPLALARATFTRADVEAVLARTASGRVAPTWAPSRSNPRCGGCRARCSTGTRRSASGPWRGSAASAPPRRRTAVHRVGLHRHLAGGYAAPFDTVYVSLWKYFNCGIGAILAGPKRVLDGMFHVRRMFGGNLAVGWPAALVARHYMDGFLDRLKSAVRVSEDFYTAIARHPKVSVSRIPNGTNVTRLTLKGANVPAVRKKLLDRHIEMPGGSPEGVVTLGVNETWNRAAEPSWRRRSSKRSDSAALRLVSLAQGIRLRVQTCGAHQSSRRNGRTLAWDI